MNKKMTKDNFVVCSFFFMVSFLKGIGLNSSNKIYIALYLILLIFASLKFFKTSINKKEIIVLLLFATVGILDYILGGESTVLFTALALFFVKNSGLRNIIFSIFWGRLIGLILMIILPLLGIMDLNVISFYRDGSFINRYSLGYSHPNLLHSTFTLCCIMYLYLKFNSIKLRHVIVIETFNIILYKLTYSRTGFIILTSMILLFYFSQKSQKLKKTIINNLNKFLLIMFLLPIIMGNLYGKIDFINTIDNILTGRIYFINMLLSNYSVPLFKISNYEGILFDNGFIDLLYNGGFVAAIIYIILQVKTNNYIKVNCLYSEALFTFAFFVYSITESCYMSFIMNISLLFFSYVIYNNKELNKKIETKTLEVEN